MCRSKVALPLISGIGLTAIVGIAQESELPISFDHAVRSGVRITQTQIHGKQYTSKLPNSPAGPLWTADNVNPPISASEAIKLAIAKRKELVENDGEKIWELEAAAIEGWDAENGYWFWKMDFKQRGISGAVSRLSIYVLMDGTVCEVEVK